MYICKELQIFFKALELIAWLSHSNLAENDIFWVASTWTLLTRHCTTTPQSTIPLQQSTDNQSTSLLQTTNLPQMHRKLSRCRQPHYNCTARVPRAHRRRTVDADADNNNNNNNNNNNHNTQTHRRCTADALQTQKTTTTTIYHTVDSWSTTDNHNHNHNHNNHNN